MQDRRSAPVIEQVLSAGFDLLQDLLVEHRRDVSVASLRRRHVEGLPRQIARVIEREAVDGVAFRHDVLSGPNEFAAEHGDSLTAQADAIPVHLDVHHSAAT